MTKNRNIFINGGEGFIVNLVEDNKIMVYDNFHRDTLTNRKYQYHKNIKAIKAYRDYPESWVFKPKDLQYINAVVYLKRTLKLRIKSFFLEGKAKLFK